MTQKIQKFIFLFFLVITDGDLGIKHQQLTDIIPEFNQNILSLPSSNINDEKILLCIPGMGFHSLRYQTILSNLQYLYKHPTSSSSSSSNLTLECIIFIYQRPLNSSQEKDLDQYCQLEYYYHGNYAMYLKSLVPYLLKESGYSHIFILLDDVRLTHSFKYHILSDHPHVLTLD